MPREGRTVASDWGVLPPGATLDLEGFDLLTVEDTGSAIRNLRLDVYFDTHEDARQFGVRVMDVRRVLDDTYTQLYGGG